MTVKLCKTFQLSRNFICLFTVPFCLSSASNSSSSSSSSFVLSCFSVGADNITSPSSIICSVGHSSSWDWFCRFFLSIHLCCLLQTRWMLRSLVQGLTCLTALACRINSHVTGNQQFFRHTKFLYHMRHPRIAKSRAAKARH